MIKLISPGNTGIPDRLALCDDGAVWFVEFKRPGGVMSERQKAWKLWLKERHYRYVEIWSKEDANDWLIRLM